VAVLTATALYPVLAADRIVAAVASLGGASLVFFVVGVALRVPGLTAWSVVLCGVEYALVLGFRTTVDRWAPIVAAALFVAAELGFRCTEPVEPAPDRDVVLRSILWLAGGALVAVAVGSILLAAAGGANAGLGLEAVGVAATVAALAFLVGVVARAAR
jgi:hypothetical protein